MENQSKISEAEFWQVIISSCLGIALLKISIALNLLRLSPSRWYTWCLWFGIGKSACSEGNTEVQEPRPAENIFTPWQFSFPPTASWRP